MAGLARGSPAAVVVQRGRPQRPRRREGTSYSDAVARPRPAVVNIFTSGTVRGGRHPFPTTPSSAGSSAILDGRATWSGLGSGVIASARDYVLTNNHVVEGMEEIEVLLADGKTRLKARLVGTDPDTDLAVLKVEGERLPAITFGAAETVRVGDVVLAIGNPFGVGQTVTIGIVSALGRRGLNLNTYENFIQTDASINVGNSGGALIDASGNLIGINTAIFSRTGGSVGIGFAIPVSTREGGDRADRRAGRGHAGLHRRADAGLAAERPPRRPNAAKTSGVLIAGVERDGPAEKAGVKAGDVLLAVNAIPTPDTGAMLDAVAELKPGSQASLQLRRDRKEFDLQVTVVKRPQVQRRRRCGSSPHSRERGNLSLTVLGPGLRRVTSAPCSRPRRLSSSRSIAVSVGDFQSDSPAGFTMKRARNRPSFVEHAHRDRE